MNRLLRPGLTVQLFLAMLVTAVLVTVAMGAAAQWNFQRGFLGYLNAQAEQQTESTLPRLQQAWRDPGHGSWDFLRDRRGAWHRLIEPPPERDGASPWDGDVEQIAPHLLGLGRRLTLLDAREQVVTGFPHPFADSVRRAIVVDGATVGWVVLAPIESVTDAAALRFLADQIRASLAMGALAVLLAAGVAWWLARALLAPVRDMAHATHRLAAGHHDVRVPVRSSDEIGRLARDFNQLAHTLARNERMRRDAMADISHELRTPLAVLRGEIEAMQDGIHPLTPQGLQVLHGEVDALAQLVDDLHALALADAGALRYRKTVLDLGALVALAAEAFAARCAERDLRLDVVPPDDGAAVPVLADPDRLRQLLHNLLDNAVRYTDPGGRLVVRLGREDGQAVLDVSDSAPGVAPELLPRLFERFFRVERSRGRASGGSGLGLAICRSIVDAHEGTIEARPSPLGGVLVRVTLPLAPADTPNSLNPPT